MTSQQPDKQRPKGPWYKHFEYWNAEAQGYLTAYANIPADAPHHAEFKSFAQFMEWRVVFESNLIEGAGLPAGETRKVVEEYFPHIPSSYEAFRSMSSPGIFAVMDLSDDDARRIANVVREHGLAVEDVRPSYVFSGKSKGIREVEQHFFALIDAKFMALEFKQALSLYRVYQSLSKRYPNQDDLPQEWKKITGQDALPDRAPPRLLTEEGIKQLHMTAAMGLLPDGSEVEPGEYRTDARSVGYDVVFPSPELVPQCMEQYVGTSNDLLYTVWTQNANPFEAAARISYDFVRIHPFPDFNGRVSRLILEMVLMVLGVPFPIALRGDKKERKRYLHALKSANQRDLQPFATLVAMRVAQGFEEVDENLTRAGLSSVLHFA